MDTTDARTFFADFARAVALVGNAEYRLLDHIAGVGKRKYSRHTNTNKSTVESSAITKILEIDLITIETKEAIQLIEQGLEYITAIERVLGSMYSDVIRLKYIEQITIKDIAKMLHTSRPTVYTRLNVALDWLDATPESYIKQYKGVA